MGTALGVTFWPAPPLMGPAAARVRLRRRIRRRRMRRRGGGIEHGILVEVDRQILAVIAVGDGALEVAEDAAQDGAAREQLGGMLHGDAARQVVLGHQGESRLR
jgi:hypothetical protein